MNRLNFYMNVVRDGLQYALFECLYLLGLIWDAQDGAFSTWYLTLGACLVILWVIATSTDEAIAEAREMVLHRELFMSDFIISTAVLLLIAFYIRHEEWYFWALMIVAAGQNLRYSSMSRQWILESLREQRTEKGHSDDDMS